MKGIEQIEELRAALIAARVRGCNCGPEHAPMCKAGIRIAGHMIDALNWVLDDEDTELHALMDKVLAQWFHDLQRMGGQG